MPLFALSAFFLAQTASPPTAAPVAPPKPVRICREGGRTLGSHMRTGRICKTAEEWDADKKGGNYIPSMTINRRQDVPIEGMPKPTCC